MGNEFSDICRHYILRGTDISVVQRTYWDQLASAETPSQEELASIVCNILVSRLTTADSKSVSGATNNQCLTTCDEATMERRHDAKASVDD